jgi:O-antigen ligase
VEPRRPQALDAGLFLLVVAAPLAVFPLATSPYPEVKTLLLALGALLVWISGLPADPRFALPAALWIGALAIATFAGVDPTQSVLGPLEGIGVVTLVIAASLLLIAPSIPERTVERTRGWIVTAGLFVAVVQVVGDLFPSVLQTVGVRDFDLRGSTLGNPIFSAAFLGTSLCALLADRRIGRARFMTTLAVLAAGFAANGERSALVVPIVALLAVWWLVRPARRRLLAAAGILLVALVVWAGLDRVGPTTSGGTTGAIAQFRTSDAEELRLAVYRANLRAFADRPILGWGPGNGWSGYLSVVTEDEVEIVGRYWLDAHNLLLESLVTTGVLGAAALLFLAFRVLRGIVRGAPAARWAAAAGLTVAVWHAYEPMNVYLTPLLFLLLGLAARPEQVTQAAEAAPAGRLSSRIAVALLGAAAVIGALALASSALEHWSRTHYAPWAIRGSVAVQPWRLSAQTYLAIELAIDGRAGDVEAGAEAREITERLVAEHPWYPDARIAAAGVENLLRNFPGAQDWIRRQHRWFPNETIPVPTEETSFGVPSGG